MRRRTISSLLLFVAAVGAHLYLQYTILLPSLPRSAIAVSPCISSFSKSTSKDLSTSSGACSLGYLTLAPPAVLAAATQPGPQRLRFFPCGLWCSASDPLVVDAWKLVGRSTSARETTATGPTRLEKGPTLSMLPAMSTADPDASLHSHRKRSLPPSASSPPLLQVLATSFPRSDPCAM
ncbi:hypothetical protein C8R45DRAFT_972950, partial [Mycena sanguinolenta]